MPSPQPVHIELDNDTRKALEALTRRHSTPEQLVIRARIILLAGDGKNNSQIVRELGVSIDMVRLWRKRWASFANIPLAVAANHWIQNRLPAARRFLASALFSAAMAVYYALSGAWLGGCGSASFVGITSTE